MENNTPILYVMVGLPGSGKSHIAEELSKEKNAVVYSMDEIRGELCGDVGDQSRNDEVFGIWVNKIRRALKHGQNVIADATNVTKSGRRSFLAMFDRIPHQTIAHVAYKEIDDCIIDNLDRPHPVPPEVIKEAKEKFTFPIKTEGFDNIVTHFYDRQKEGDREMITLRAEDFTKEDFQKLRELFHVSDTTQEFTFSTPIVTQNKTDTANTWKSIVKKLTNAFPNSFINYNLEFITDTKTNNYFILEDCKTELDIKCKVLEWLSRAACYATPYQKDKSNKAYQDNLRECINRYLGTDFTKEDMEEIYTKLGNRYDHALTVEFIKSGYRMEVLREKENDSYENPEL